MKSEKHSKGLFWPEADELLLQIVIFLVGTLMLVMIAQGIVLYKISVTDSKASHFTQSPHAFDQQNVGN